MPNLATPGVYIVELPATGPIAGVGTSTPAFLGPALSGPTGQPVLISNWTEFLSTFGGYITSHYLANAVRGFYDNGGTTAYIVRVGTAAPASLDLLDRGQQPAATLHVQAKNAGIAGNSFTVTVADSHLVNGAKLVKNTTPAVTISGALTAGASIVTLTNAADSAKFQPGDFITLNDSTTEHVQIARIRGAQLFLASGLVGAYPSGATLRVANLVPGQTTFRVAAGAGLQAGSVVNVSNGTVKEDHVVDVAITFGDGSVMVSLSKGLTSGISLKGTDPDVTVTSYEFDLTFNDGNQNEPTNTFLSMDPRHSRYVTRGITSSIVTVSQPLAPATPSAQAAPANMPAKTTSPLVLGGGADDNINQIGVNQYQAALGALEVLSDVNMVCVPDAALKLDVQAAVRDHCEKMGDRFAILDARPDATADLSGGSLLSAQRANCESQRGYAALYFPWIKVSDPLSQTGDDMICVPPSGHMAGVYARVDDARGVHKAPANEPVRAALGLAVVVDDGTHGVLNKAGIDVLRVFPGAARPMVWGARTTVPVGNVSYQYVNVRRLLLFIEQSIKQGIRWAVFEPNNTTLWKKLSRTITEFLTRVWRSGALFGNTAAEAFYVKIDEENNPEALRALGQVNIEIGVSPTEPAEFVVVTIGLWQGGSSIAEG